MIYKYLRFSKNEETEKDKKKQLKIGKPVKTTIKCSYTVYGFLNISITSGTMESTYKK